MTFTSPSPIREPRPEDGAAQPDFGTLQPAPSLQSTLLLSGLTSSLNPLSSGEADGPPRDMVDLSFPPRAMSDPSFLNADRGALVRLVRASDRTRIMRNALGMATRLRAASGATSAIDGCSQELTPAAQHGQDNSAIASPSSAGCPRVGSNESDISASLDTWGCTCAVVNLILGNAVFTLPYGFLLSGWISAPLVIITIGLFCYTAILMGHALEEARIVGFVQPDYGIVGELAFGRRFRSFFTLFCVGECFFMCVFFLVFIAETIARPLRLPKDLLIAAAAASGALLSLVPKRFIALVSVVGLGLTVTCAFVVVFHGLSLHHWGDGQSLYGKRGPCGAVYTVSFVAIAVADHPVFPGLYNSVEEPKDFVKGIKYGFSFFTLAAVVLCCTSYLTFGSTLQSVVLINIGHDGYYNPIARLAWMQIVANMLIAFRSLLVLPSFIRPVVGAIQDTFLGVAELRVDARLRSKRRGVRLFLIFAAFGLCAVAAVALVDFLPEVENLTSSLFKSMNALIIPCWSYYRLCKGHLVGKPLQRLFLFVVIFGAIFWGCYGTYSAMVNIAR